MKAVAVLVAAAVAVLGPSSTEALAASGRPFSAILLAGGVGSRMKADRPKQFLDLCGKPVVFHTLDLFLNLPGLHE